MNEMFINDIDLDTCENNIVIERALLDSNISLDLIYFEDGDENNDSSLKEKIEEKVQRVIDIFKRFIQKCKDYLKHAYEKLFTRIEEVVVEYSLKDVLRDFNESIKAAEESGMKSFEFTDMDALYKVLKTESKEFEDLIKDFSRKYLKKGSPKDAEKILSQYKTICDKYNSKMDDIISKDKTYSIKEAKRLVVILKINKEKRSGSFMEIIDDYNRVCDEVESLAVSILNSLDQYSEETGWIQNAKTVQELIHNSCVQLNTHAAECITKLVKEGVPLLCSIYRRYIDSKDEPESEHKKNSRNSTLNKISTGAQLAGNLGNTYLTKKRKSDRKEDLNNWKTGASETPFRFDKTK